MNLVFLDLETKHSFSSVADRDPAKLGVSVWVFTSEEKKEVLGLFLKRVLIIFFPFWKRQTKLSALIPLRESEG